MELCFENCLQYGSRQRVYFTHFATNFTLLLIFTLRLILPFNFMHVTANFTHIATKFPRLLFFHCVINLTV